jgi:endonuclease III
MSEDIFRGVGVKITLYEPDDFLKVKETLSRIGVSSNRTKTLYPSCHILHKQGQYAVLHFKELFKLDGKPANISEEDLARRNTICRLLDEWGLCEVIDKTEIEEQLPVTSLKILPYHLKHQWTIVPKYTIGK